MTINLYNESLFNDGNNSGGGGDTPAVPYIIADFSTDPTTVAGDWAGVLAAVRAGTPATVLVAQPAFDNEAGPIYCQAINIEAGTTVNALIFTAAELSIAEDGTMFSTLWAYQAIESDGVVSITRGAKVDTGGSEAEAVPYVIAEFANATDGTGTVSGDMAGVLAAVRAGEPATVLVKRPLSEGMDGGTPQYCVATSVIAGTDMDLLMFTAWEFDPDNSSSTMSIYQIMGAEGQYAVTKIGGVSTGGGETAIAYYDSTAQKYVNVQAVMDAIQAHKPYFIFGPDGPCYDVIPIGTVGLYLTYHIPSYNLNTGGGKDQVTIHTVETDGTLSDTKTHTVYFGSTATVEQSDVPPSGTAVQNYVTGIVGDISTAVDSINGENI